MGTESESSSGAQSPSGALGSTGSTEGSRAKDSTSSSAIEISACTPSAQKNEAETDGILPKEVAHSTHVAATYSDDAVLPAALTPTLYCELAKFKGAMIGAAPLVVDFDRKEGHSSPPSAQRSQLMEEALPEGPRIEGKTQRCAVVNRYLQNRMRRVFTRHYEKAGQLLVLERRGLEMNVLHELLPYPHVEIVTAPPALPANWAPACLD